MSAMSSGLLDHVHNGVSKTKTHPFALCEVIKRVMPVSPTSSAS